MMKLPDRKPPTRATRSTNTGTGAAAGELVAGSDPRRARARGTLNSPPIGKFPKRDVSPARGPVARMK